MEVKFIFLDESTTSSAVLHTSIIKLDGFYKDIDDNRTFKANYSKEKMVYLWNKRIEPQCREQIE